MIYGLLLSGPILAVLTHLLYWQSRFYFDDEWFNLKLIANLSFPDLLGFLSKNDIHPPLSYILNLATYRLFGPDEFFMSLPSLIFTGLSAGLIGLLVYKITGPKAVSILALFIAVIHPNFQLFGWSIRWYPLWNLLTLFSIYTVIEMWAENSPRNYLKCGILTLSLSAAVYTNYLTFFLIFTIIMISVMKLFVTRSRKSDVSPKRYILTGSAAIVSLLTLIPWITPLLQHLANFFQNNQILQSTYFKTLSSLFYGFYSIFTSIAGAAIYPWNSSFIVLTSSLIIGITAFLIYSLLNKLDTVKNSFSFKGLKSFIDKGLFIDLLMISAVLFLLFAGNAVATHSHKARGLLPLSSLSIIIVSVLLHNVIKMLKSSGGMPVNFWSGVQMITVTYIICAWMAGSIGVLQKKHLHKLAFADPVPEIISIIGDEIDRSECPVVVITTHSALTFYSLWQNLNGKLTVISPLTDSVPNFIEDKSRDFIQRIIPPAPYKLIIVNSYLGSFLPQQDIVNETFDMIRSHGESIASTKKLYADLDYSFKQKLFPKSDLRQWRFVIDTFQIESELDKEILDRFREL